ncbi:hypothetical protein CCR75_008464 [Bremia lactucae]|uniref:Ubiquitin-like domain-containing protein n=1 Tax=Bremia lactucae TaxID=4779 RepID=A0A976FG61_BRELC|nr:hypothetical protein CCR75_008464 [Bremia lactucae]
MADELIIKVVSGASESLHVNVDLATTSVLALKQHIETKNAQQYPLSAQRLIFQGQILQDDKLLTDYRVTAGCALHLTLTPGTTAGPATACASSAPPAELRTFLQQMRAAEPPEQYATAVRTLQKICANVVDHPNEEKYRKLRVDNSVLKAKLLDRTAGQDCVKLLGFQEAVQANHVVLVPTPERWENLVACKAVIDSTAVALDGPAPAAALPFGAAPSSGNRGLGGDFAAQAQSVLQNPAMLQTMMNNPMVQQVAQQNPMLAQVLQNPSFLAQSMQVLQQNPGMLQQMSQMMSDPNGMARMQQMMAGGGLGSSSFGAAAPLSAAATNPFSVGDNLFASNLSAPAPPASTPAPVSSSSPIPTSSAATSTDHSNEAYDEDEIARAIARSLQDE